MDNKPKKEQLSRRRFIGSSALIASLSTIPLSFACKNTATASTEVSTESRLNSKFGGVQIGTITYSFRGINGVDETIKACAEAGVSSVELMGNGVEEYLGAPKNPVQRQFRFPGGAPGGMPPAGGPGAGAPPQKMMRPEPVPLTPEEEAAEAAYKEELATWRAGADVMAKWEGLKKKFDDAGIKVHIFKWTAGDTDEELDYSFQAAKALGAMGITTEMTEESAQSLGPAAERNGMLAIYHNHGQYHDMTLEDIERLLNYSPANRLNFDAGHYFGFGYDATGKVDVLQFINHFASMDKIASIHLKDKTSLNNESLSNANQVWGQGETPIEDILKLVQTKYSTINCDIELEYQVKDWSTAVKEVNTCVNYCREILI